MTWHRDVDWEPPEPVGRVQLGRAIPDWRARLMRSHNRVALGDRAATQGLLSERFFTEHWGRRPVRVGSVEIPTGDWVERCIRTALALPERAQLQTHDGRSALVGGEGALRAGISEQLLAVADVHPELPFAARLAAAFRAWFGCPVTTGLYLNGTGAPGFVEHHDAHHVFALQLHGAKSWFVGPPALAHPSRRYDDAGEGALATRCIRVEAGELIYLPAGVRHRAEPDGVSVHLSVGVHTPCALDAIEAALAEVGRSMSGLREPLSARFSSSGAIWSFDRQDLADQLRQAADSLDRVGPQLALADGTRISVQTPEPRGSWPIVDGVFQPHPAPVSSRALQIAARAAATLGALPGVVAVAARGSVLRDDSNRDDLDLVALTHGPVADLRGALDPMENFDLRVFDVGAVLADAIPLHTRLALGFEAHWLFGEPPWESPPQLVASPELARRLRAEQRERWVGGVRRLYAHRRSAGFEPAGVRWAQKSALRGVLPLALAHRRYTRHPQGCVQLTAALRPGLQPLAEAVRTDLYGRLADPAAVSRAVELGGAWFE